MEDPVLLVMAITEGWADRSDGANKRVRSTCREKQNVPPFWGGTWQSFYAQAADCQPVLEPG
jgi:hypothetical protein